MTFGGFYLKISVTILVFIEKESQSVDKVKYSKVSGVFTPSNINNFEDWKLLQFIL